MRLIPLERVVTLFRVYVFTYFMASTLLFGQLGFFHSLSFCILLAVILTDIVEVCTFNRVLVFIIIVSCLVRVCVEKYKVARIRSCATKRIVCVVSNRSRTSIMHNCSIGDYFIVLFASKLIFFEILSSLLCKRQLNSYSKRKLHRTSRCS